MSNNTMTAETVERLRLDYLAKRGLFRQHRNKMRQVAKKRSLSVWSTSAFAKLRKLSDESIDAKYKWLEAVNHKEKQHV